MRGRAAPPSRTGSPPGACWPSSTPAWSPPCGNCSSWGRARGRRSRVGPKGRGGPKWGPEGPWLPHVHVGAGYKPRGEKAAACRAGAQTSRPARAGRTSPPARHTLPAAGQWPRRAAPAWRLQPPPAPAAPQPAAAHCAGGPGQAGAGSPQVRGFAGQRGLHGFICRCSRHAPPAELAPPLSTAQPPGRT